jgi:hypothetical protein
MHMFSNYSLYVSLHVDILRGSVLEGHSLHTYVCHMEELYTPHLCVCWCRRGVLSWECRMCERVKGTMCIVDV